MIRKRLLIALTSLVLLSVSVGASREGPPPEVIRFEGTTGRPFEAPGVYPRVYSGRVEFPHGRHVSDYGVTCEVCHHADSFDPAAGMDSEVEITRCVDCHDAPGLVYGRQVDEMDGDDLLMHRANVMHQRCRGCHEESSAENRSIVAPIACRGCHAQRESDWSLTDSPGD